MKKPLTVSSRILNELLEIVEEVLEAEFIRADYNLGSMNQEETTLVFNSWETAVIIGGNCAGKIDFKIAHEMGKPWKCIFPIHPLVLADSISAMS